MSKRKSYIELIRILTCFNVVLLHIHLYNSNMITFIISGISVPLFILITGYCLFARKKDYKQLLKKNFFRIYIPVFIMITISIIFKNWILGDSTFLNCIYQINPLDLIKPYLSISTLYFTNIYGLTDHLWFLTVYFGIIIGYPIFKNLCSSDKEQTLCRRIIIFFLIITFIFNDLRYFKITEIIPIEIFYQQLVLYILIGYELYLNKDKIFRNKIIIYIISILMIVLSVTLKQLFFIHRVSPSDIYYSNTAFPVLLQSIGVFILIGNIGLFIKDNNKIIKHISDKTLGIYIIHWVVIQKLKNMNAYNFLKQKTINYTTVLGQAIFEILFAIGIFIFCFIIITILKELFKLIKKHIVRKKVLT